MIPKQPILYMLVLLLAAMVLSACQSNTGSGPITLSPDVLRGYQRFKEDINGTHFYVTKDGRGYAYMYCDVGPCVKNASGLSFCYKRNKRECKLFARGHGKIVWKHSSGRPVTLQEVSGGRKSIPQATKSPDFSRFTDVNLCYSALHIGRTEWDSTAAVASHVQEAKSRNLTPQKCTELIYHPKAKINTSSSTSNTNDEKSEDIQLRLEKLKSLIDKGLITEEEAAQKRKEILEGL